MSLQKSHIASCYFTDKSKKAEIKAQYDVKGLSEHKHQLKELGKKDVMIPFIDLRNLQQQKSTKDHKKKSKK